MTAPPAYGIECDWGTISVTEDADMALGLTPQTETNRAFATYGDRTRTPYEVPLEPPVHVLIADQAQLAAQPEVVDDVSSYAAMHPKALHVVLGAGGIRDHIDIDLGMQLTAGAQTLGFDSIDDVQVVDRDGRTVPFSEARRSIVDSNTANAIANAAMATVESAWPIWQRNDINGDFMRRLKRVGLTAAGLTVLMEVAGAATNDPIDRPGILLVLLGATGYFGVRRFLKGTTEREMFLRSHGRQIAYHIGHSIAHALYAPPETFKGNAETAD